MAENLQKNGSIEKFIRTVKGQNNFKKRIIFQLVIYWRFLLIQYIETIKVSVGANNWNVET